MWEGLPDPWQPRKPPSIVRRVQARISSHAPSAGADCKPGHGDPSDVTVYFLKSALFSMAYSPMQTVGHQYREFPEPIGPIIGSLLIGRKALSSVHAVLPIPPQGPFVHYASTEPIFRPAGLRGPCLQPRKGLGNPRPRTPKPLSTVLEHGAIALVRALPRSLPRGGSRPLPVPRLQRHQDQRSLLAPTQPLGRVSGQPIPGPHRARAGRVRTLRPGLTRGGMVATAARPAIPSPPDTAPNPALAVGLAESPEEFRSPSRPAFRILPACST